MRTDDVECGPASWVLNVAVVDSLVVGVASDLDEPGTARDPAKRGSRAIDLNVANGSTDALIAVHPDGNVLARHGAERRVNRLSRSSSSKIHNVLVTGDFKSGS